MEAMKKLTAAALLIIAGLLIVFANLPLPSAFSFGTEHVNIRETYSKEAVDSIYIRSGSTDVEVVRGESNQIEISLTGRASKKYVPDLKLDTELEGGRLTIEPDVKDNIWSFGINVLSVDVVVALPDQVWDSVELQVGSGNIGLSKLNAKALTASTQSGNAKLSKIEAGTVAVELGSGNIVVEGLQADAIATRTNSGNTSVTEYQTRTLVFKTGSGNVSIEDGVGEVKGETTSGNIIVKVDSIASDMDVETGSGNVTIQLAEEPKALAFEFTTKSGHSSIDWPYRSASTESEEDTHRTGMFGDGAVRLVAESGSGNITVKQR
jgi:lia operon protein LiaG